MYFFTRSVFIIAQINTLMGIENFHKKSQMSLLTFQRIGILVITTKQNEGGGLEGFINIRLHKCMVIQIQN